MLRPNPARSSRLGERLNRLVLSLSGLGVQSRHHGETQTSEVRSKTQRARERKRQAPQERRNPGRDPARQTWPGTSPRSRAPCSDPAHSSRGRLHHLRPPPRHRAARRFPATRSLGHSRLSSQPPEDRALPPLGRPQRRPASQPRSHLLVADRLTRPLPFTPLNVYSFLGIFLDTTIRLGAYSIQPCWKPSEP